MKWLSKLLGTAAVALSAFMFTPKKAEACSSAISIGRGGCNVSIADDASAVYWNPAGLVQLTEPELDMTISPDDDYRTFLCYGQPLSKRTAIGFNFTRREREVNDADFSHLWVKLSYSGKLTEKLSVGSSLTLERIYINGNLCFFGDKRIETFSNIDLGILYKPTKKVNLGLLLQRDGSRHDNNIRPGVSIRLNDKDLLAIEGYDITNAHSKRAVRFGLERKINEKWSARAGLRINPEATNPDVLFDGILDGSAGFSYRKGSLEASVAYIGGLVLTLNQKF